MAKIVGEMLRRFVGKIVGPTEERLYNVVNGADNVINGANNVAATL